MSEHQKYAPIFIELIPLTKRLIPDWNPMESDLAKFVRFFLTGCKNIGNLEIGEIIKNKRIRALPDWVGLEMLQKALLDSLQIVQKLQHPQSRLQAIENLRNNQEIHWIGHNSSVHRVFADPSAEHF